MWFWVLGASAALLVARARLVWAMRCVAVRVCAGIGGAECQAGGVQRVREGRTRAHTSWEKKVFFSHPLLQGARAPLTIWLG